MGRSLPSSQAVVHASPQAGLPDPSYFEDADLAPALEPGDPTALQSVPWLAVALASHVILLVAAWFISPAGVMTREAEVISASREVEALPPEPPMEKPEETEYPHDDPVVEQPTEDPRLVPDPKDLTNEDPSNSPNRDLAENPNNDPSKAESPYPNKRNPNSAVGIGGAPGGGGGPGGAGGFDHRRAQGGPNGVQPDNEKEVDAALDWLRDHQNNQGYWSATRFSEDSKRLNARKTYNIEFVREGDPEGDKGWEACVDVGLTGLALLAYAGRGYDHKAGDYRETCKRAINYLRKVQDNDGCFGSKEDDCFVYNHAIATMAMAEIYGLSQDRILKPSVEKGVSLILQCQNPGYGWRYGVRSGDNDSSVTGWMVLALKSCRMAGLEFDGATVYSGAAQWFTDITAEVGGYPKTGYTQPGSNNGRLRTAADYDNNASLDAIYVMSMLFMEKADTKDATVRRLAQVCIEDLPAWDHLKIDYYYWYYASLAIFQMGDKYWEKWDKALMKAVVDHQRGFCEADKGSTAETLDEHGSWDPVDAWGEAGGRVYATAINCLTLQARYRYQRLNGDD